ncbi:ATP phosphoribosyltransferase [Chrysochromulina tobinii]|uniref:ATP phosphoribosyltransferase n=1 Tax=Chrysochromulina tobinii TaxID=1460289 RepID=A0A0M0JM70_9EUKA|nr:ATP phosphoribosyltransferase [Chrysochromulina tobinii]|eukprot:KOO27671.1 ATP phosphoribosyltransferase [Chrysochromulina sp. CCMP291]
MVHMLRRLKPEEIPMIRRDPVDSKARLIAEPIVDAVRTEGEAAVRRYAEQFGEIQPGGKLILRREVELREAYDSISADDRACIERTAARIRAFAAAQRASISALKVPIPGGEAGHTVEPVEAAGCYAPGGRYPLPSSVLMTGITARVAGCSRVVVASPRPSAITMAAAYVAEADVLLPIGGAHAIATLAYGAGELLEACDAVVGPGNQYVTAAKSLVAGRVAIDMLAGPSECLVIADDDADAATVAKDLLAQAEHDPQALPALICLSEAFAAAVDAQLEAQLAVLPTADIASVALKNGYTVVVGSVEEAAAISDRLAVEHVELHIKNAMQVGMRLKHYGGLFIGGNAAEVLGDYVPSGISTRGNSDERLLIAIPKKGRMHEKCLKFLEAAGLEYERPDRVDVALCTNMPIKIVFLPASDIAMFVGEGNVDVGITGEDIIAESEQIVHVNLKLGFGKCRLGLQVPEEHKGQPLSAYVGSRIVTSFPNIAAKFFKPLDDAASAQTGTKVQTKIKVLGGSVEAACGLGLADAVIDLVETGTTMKAAGLCMLETLMTTEAVLISNPQSKHPELTRRIIDRIQGYMDSTKYQLINYNVSREVLPAAMKITPGKKSPSILPLERGDWVAVHAMVIRKEVPNIIDELCAVGATDIIVFALANCRV